MKKVVLIPSYEPDDKLIKLVENLSKEDLDVIVVDDGSGKKYKDIFTKVSGTDDFVLDGNTEYHPVSVP